MPKVKIIETKEQAISQLKKVLNWKKFCDAHRTVSKAIEIILKEVKNG